jgi:hypothetical protein
MGSSTNNNNNNFSYVEEIVKKFHCLQKILTLPKKSKKHN